MSYKLLDKTTDQIITYAIVCFGICLNLTLTLHDCSI